MNQVHNWKQKIILEKKEWSMGKELFPTISNSNNYYQLINIIRPHLGNVHMPLEIKHTCWGLLIQLKFNHLNLTEWLVKHEVQVFVQYVRDSISGNVATVATHNICICVLTCVIS